ncbi:MAG TPA: polysaccharide biosynthesis tyrosine autokinase [Chitinophagaceae bacterium]|nr:polysaccharide biosynthesis tyrosine autokinase [Chitinophagaceae bacterium]
MTTVNKKKTDNNSNSILSLVMFRYMPYWPLFLILLILSGAGAVIYLKLFATPLYQSSASILVKDEKKGVEESKTIESLNSVETKTIVENELKVLNSRTLVDQVVRNLSLYAPILEEGRFRTSSAYVTSPIVIQAQDPDNLVPQKKVYFTMDKQARQVVIGQNRFPLDSFVKTPFGTLKFIENPRQEADAKGPLYFMLADPRTVTDGLIASLRVTAPDKVSSIINLELNTDVPRKGKDILQELIKAYNAAAVKDKDKLAASTVAFLDNRIAIVGRELDSIEKKVQSYKSSRGIVNLSQQGSQYLQSVGDNDKKLTDINTQLTVLDEVEKQISNGGSMASIVPSSLGINDQILSSQLEKLYTAEIQYEKLKQTTGENSPILTSVTSEIERMRPDIMTRIQSQRRSLEAQKNNLASTNSTYTSMLQTIPEQEKELVEISRQQSIKNEVYQFLLQKREETALARASTISESRVLDPAETSPDPVSPKKMFIYLIAVILAMGIGIGYVSMREFMTNKIMFRSDIEELTTVPVVGEITAISKGNIFVKNSKKIARTALVEQFRQLRMGLGLYSKQTQKRKILVTSSIGGEGKSFVSGNLAKSLASSGKKVVLIDFDMRNPKTTGLFKLENKFGIKEYLEESREPEEIIHATDTDHLFVIPAGEIAVNPTELLLGARLGELFEYLENNFDYIIADTAPVQPVTDAYIISEYIDATIFVVRHRYTPKVMVQMLDDNNKIKALNNLNIVFNGVKSRGFFGSTGFGYGYGYGYEYGYGERKYMGHAGKQS